MIGSLIEIGLGYFIWKYVPGMISRISKKTQQILEIIGIILMVIGGISFIKSIGSLVGL